VEKPVTIVAAIKELREQLEKARLEVDDGRLGLLLEHAEVELSIAFKGETEAGGGVKAWVVDLSGKLKETNEVGHKVKLLLKPAIKGKSSPLPVSDRERIEAEHPTSRQRK
jgi:hypothetical protein